MSRMSKIETVTPSGAGDQDVRLLHADELDAVSGGGKTRGESEQYLKLELKTVYVSSY